MIEYILMAIFWIFAAIGLITVYFMATRTDPGLDQTARFMNGVACWWAAMKHRLKLFKHCSIEDENGNILDMEEGQYSFEDGNGVTHAVYLRRPYKFLERDWLESMGFRKTDSKVS